MRESTYLFMSDTSSLVSPLPWPLAPASPLSSPLALVSAGTWAPLAPSPVPAVLVPAVIAAWFSAGAAPWTPPSDRVEAVSAWYAVVGSLPELHG